MTMRLSLFLIVALLIVLYSLPAFAETGRVETVRGVRKDGAAYVCHRLPPERGVIEFCVFFGERR